MLVANEHQVEVQTSSASLNEAYAVIEGVVVKLPKSAKYICQDKRGCWYYCGRRPRIKDGDWTPNKSPIMILNDQGHQRVLITEVKGSWKTTLQMPIIRSYLPTP